MKEDVGDTLVRALRTPCLPMIQCGTFDLVLDVSMNYEGAHYLLVSLKPVSNIRVLKRANFGGLETSL